MKNWVLGNKNSIFWASLAALALILAFGLGYLYAGKQTRAPIIIEKCSSVAGAN